MKPDKLRPPVEDGKLESKECAYVYVTGQTNTSFSRSPLIADEMESAGTYSKYHPLVETTKGRSSVMSAATS